MLKHCVLLHCFSFSEVEACWVQQKIIETEDEDSVFVVPRSEIVSDNDDFFESVLDVS